MSRLTQFLPHQSQSDETLAEEYETIFGEPLDMESFQAAKELEEIFVRLGHLTLDERRFDGDGKRAS